MEQWVCPSTANAINDADKGKGKSYKYTCDNLPFILSIARMRA